MRFKQNRGQAYARGAYRLRSFDRYVAEHHRGQSPLDWESLVSGWLGRQPARKSRTVRDDLATIRQFCLFRGVTILGALFLNVTGDRQGLDQTSCLRSCQLRRWQN